MLNSRGKYAFIINEKEAPKRYSSIGTLMLSIDFKDGKCTVVALHRIKKAKFDPLNTDKSYQQLREDNQINPRYYFETNNYEKITDGVRISVGDGIFATAKCVNNTISLDIQQPDSSYDVKIQKVDKNNKPISGVKFNVNDKEIPETTDENGYVTIGQKIITEDDYQNIDEYKITEIDVGSNTGLVKLKDPITVYVEKDLDSETNNYIVKSATFDKEKKTTEQEVTLENGRKVKVTATIKNNTVTVTIPNEKGGSYDLKIKKVGENNNPVSGVTFYVKEKSKSFMGSTSVAQKPTDSDGYVEIAKQDLDESDEGKQDSYEITEIDVGSNTGLVKLKDPVTIFVNKGLNADKSAYVATSVSFNENSVSTEQEVELTDGRKVKVTASIDEIGKNITVTIPNRKPATYKFGIVKINSSEENKRVSGVTFKVNNEVKGPTDKNGYITVAQKNITKENYTKIDDYTISEINVGDNIGLVTLNAPVTIHIKKELDTETNTYKVKSVSFDGTKENVTEQEVELTDGRKVKVTATIADNTITVTIPNKNIYGSYNVRIKKVNNDEADEKPLSGVTFKINNENTKPTDKNGYVTIAQKNITKGNYNTIDNYTISEVNVGGNTGLVKLKDPVTLRVKKGINGKKTAYIPTSISLGENNNPTAQKAEQEVTLEDGRKVKVKATLENNTVTVTIPNKNESSYRVKIQKISNNEIEKNTNKKKVLQGVTFKVNNEDKGPTDRDGYVTIAEKKITGADKDTPDKYTISEVNVGKNTGLVKLKDPVTVVVRKGLDEQTNSYVAKSVSLNEANANTTEQEVTLEDGRKVKVTATIKDNTVIVTIPNEKKEKVKVLVKKTDKDGKEELKGGQFEIYCGSAINADTLKGTVAANGEVDLGEFSYNETLKNIWIKEATPPTGYANKMKDGDIFLYGLASVKFNNGKLEKFGYTGTVFKQGGNIYNNNANEEFYSVSTGKKIIETRDSITNTTILEQVATITFTIKDPALTGSYNIKIRKVDQDNKPLSGVTFQYNNRATDPTGTDGYTTLGSSTITKDNVNTADKYTISEIDVGGDTGIVTLNEPLNIIVNKGENDKHDAYTVTSAKFNYGETALNNGNAVTKDVALKDGTIVAVKLEVKDGNITVTIPNKKTRKVKVIVKKTDKDGKEELKGGQFEIYYGNAINADTLKGTVAAGGTVDLGEFSYNEELKWILIKEATPPTGYINKMKKGDMFLYGLAATYLKDGQLMGGSYNGQLLYDDLKTLEGLKPDILQVSLGTTTDSETKEQVATITFTIKDPALTGSYNIKIRKVDQDNKPLSGVTFQYNNRATDPTGTDGYTTLGSSTITKDNVNTADKYTISEIDVGGDTGIVTLNEPLNIIVNKGENDKHDAYIVTSAQFKYGDTALNNGDAVTKDVVLKDGTTVTVKLEVKDGNVTVTIPNKKTKKVRVLVQKEDMEGHSLEGGQFEIYYGDSLIKKDESGAKYIDTKYRKGSVEAGGIVDLGEFPYTTNLEGIWIKEATPPTGYINQMKKGDMFLYGLASVRLDNGTLKAREYNGKVFCDDLSTLETLKPGILQVSLTTTTDSATNEQVETVIFTIKDPPKDGTYDFKLTKTDTSKQIIKDEVTKFDVNIYSTMTSKKVVVNGKEKNSVSFSDKQTIKNAKGEEIKTTDISAPTGVTIALDGIAIQKEDIDKTFYFVVSETQAPDNYTRINYQVVVPIKFTEESGGYVATKGDAFALKDPAVSNNGVSGYRVNLANAVTYANEITSTEQTGVTINVKIPNKPKDGSFSINLIKYIEGTYTPLAGAKFTVRVTDANGKCLTYKNGSQEIPLDGNANTKTFITGVDGYFTEQISGINIDSAGKTYSITINEIEPPAGYLAVEPITFTATSKAYGDGYVLDNSIPNITNKNAEAEVKQNSINVTYYNTPKNGTFDFSLVKYQAGTTNPLEGAEFKVKIYDENNNLLKGLKEDQVYTTDKNGVITPAITGLEIDAAGKEYTVEIEETKAPDGYIGQTGIMTFKVQSVDNADKTSYILKANNDIVITNKKDTNAQVSAKAKSTSGSIGVTVYNTPKHGSFNFKLVKYKKNTQELIANAGFTIDIRNTKNNEPLKDSVGNSLDGTKTYYTTANPKEPGINLNGLNIDKEGITYKIVLKETVVPDGYIGLPGKIEFTAVSIWDNTSKSYKLETNTSTTIANTKKVDVKEGEILVEAENTPKPEIHKGVKDIKNQDSGYDGNTKHDWVINSTVPLGISSFKKYVVTDTIDSRLVFLKDSVVVRIKGGNTLVKDKDYKLDYSDTTRMLEISFIKDSFKAGQSLPENSTIEIKFNTTFAKDKDGNIIALNKEVPNETHLIFDNGSGETTLVSEKPEVHTGGLKVLKYTTKNGQKVPIEGAVFKLATSEENAKKNIFIKIKDENGKDTSTDISGISDSNGIVTFQGLEFGGDAMSNEANKKTASTGAEVYDYDYNGNISRDYWLVETFAPEGYKKNASPLKVTITKDSYDQEVSNLPSVPNTAINGNYSIKLKKVNKSDKSPISNASFKITSSTVGKANRSVETDRDGILDVTNGVVTIVSNKDEVTSDSTKVGTCDRYYITENSATEHLILKNAIDLYVYKKEITNEKYVVSKIMIKEVGTNNQKTLEISDSNRSVTLSGVKLADNVKTVDITFSVDNNNNITVEVPNDNLEGKYNIELIKKDSESGKIIGKIPFNVNNVLKRTNESDGILKITDGDVNITKANVNTKDTYTIQEKEDENTVDISIIRDPITLTLTKGMNSAGDAYMVKMVQVACTSSTGASGAVIGIDPYTNIGVGYFNVVAKDGKDIKCTLTVDRTGKISIEVGNPPKSGKYNLKIHKSIIKNDNTESNLAGVKFNIDSEAVTTAADGNTDVISKTITKDNYKTTDTIKISEVSSTDDTTIKLKNALTLEVTKKINSANNGYTINTIKISENNTNNATQAVAVNEQKGATLTLKGVTLVDGRTIDITVSVGSSSDIVVNIKNRQMTGKYTLKVRKVDSITGGGLNGVTFNGKDKNNADFSVVTKTENNVIGIATIAQDVPINSKTTDLYKINEAQLPDGLKTKYLQLTDYGLNVKVFTKMNNEKTKYVVDTVQLIPAEKGKSATNSRQKEIIGQSSFEIKDNVITVTIKNEQTRNYNFKIKKVDMNNNAIKGAKFTVYEDGTKIIDNATLGDMGEKLIERTQQLINTVHTYKIYENSPELGYDNVLENVYLQIKIVIDQNGKVTVNQNGKGQLAGVQIYPTTGKLSDENAAKEILQKYAQANNTNIVTDDGNNTFTLHIPNPRSTTNFNFKLNKHEENSENVVKGAVFDVKRLYVAKEGNSYKYDNIVNKFTNGTGLTTLPSITTGSNTSIDNVENMEVDDTYYYELTESTVPANYICTYKKAIVRIHANLDKTLTKTIVAIMENNSDKYTLYNELNSNQTSIISLTGNNENGNEVQLNWVNKLGYTIVLNKKQFSKETRQKDGKNVWSNYLGLPGAKFTVKEVSPVKQTLCDHEVLRDVNTFNNLYANSNTTYEYTIVEDEAPEGYINHLKDVVIHLYVKTNSDGTINDAPNATKIELTDTSGNKLGNIKENYLKDKIGIEVQNKKNINLYILNEKKNLKIAILKTSDKKDGNDKLIGISGVEFGILGPNLVPIKDKNGNNYVTDENGYLYIDGIELNNGIQNYVITEQSVPDGVTMIKNTQILVAIDTTGLTSPEQITDDRIKVTVSATAAGGLNSIKGLETEVKDSTIILKIPNETHNYRFSLFKRDEIGNLINDSDQNGAASFTISKYNESTKKYDVLHTGEMGEGFFANCELAEPDKTYTYKIEETSSKYGYINILQGYELYVDIQTNENAAVKREGYTSYRLVAKENEKQLFTEGEVRALINLTVQASDTNGEVQINIKNPYSYNLTINKKSKNGDAPVNKATIVAERIDGVKAKDLYMTRDATTKQKILKEIVDSTNKTSEVKLDRVPTITSDDLLIKYNSSLMPLDDTTQTWRIKESDVQKPYVNALGDNYIIVQTVYHDGALNIVSHQDMINSEVKTLNYYVCDKNGNDITSKYLNIVDAKVEKINGKWNLGVTVKDPLKYYVNLTKVEYNSEDSSEYTLLKGAELEMSGNGNKVSITNGASTSESIPVEANPGDVTSFTVEELSSAAGHTNVLKDKKLTVIVRTDINGDASVVGTVIVDTKLGKQLSDSEKQEVLKYIKFVKGTSPDGYPMIKVYVKNPIEYKFKLQKQDGSGDPLNGTEIEVKSSKSGTHYLNQQNLMEFVEGDLKPKEIVSYTIREIHTVENSAYINEFNKPMNIVVRIGEDGKASIVASNYVKTMDDGTVTNAPLSELKFLNYGITEDSSKYQTLYVALKNPTQIDVEVLKLQAGSGETAIANTEFTMTSSFSGGHDGLTDGNGKIAFNEHSMVPGDYTYRMTEKRPASDCYVNVLDGIFIKADITVANNGAITIKGVNYYYTNNSQKVTDSKLLAKLQKYTSVTVDTSNVVQKLIFKVKDPIKTQLTVIKNQADGGTPLQNARFEINSELSGKTDTKTDISGQIVVDSDEWIDPGVYKYEITEIETAGKQYNNILEGNKIIAYVKITGTGKVTLVADKNGTEFAKNTKYKYYIKKTDGSEPNSESVNKIHEFTDLSSDGRNITFNVTNPVKYRMNIIKKNLAGNDVSDTTFTVIRDNKVQLLNKGVVTTGNEIEEQKMTEGSYTFDITENATKPNSAYINILENKFIRVYTELKENGVVKIKDSEENNSSNYFEIYEGNIAGSNAKLLDKEEYASLYKLISVRAEDDDNDGIYTIDVTVTNPIKIDVEILKKQLGINGKGIANTKFTITRDENNKHENILTNTDGKYDFTEEQIKPGNYTYKVEELSTASSKYINILDKKYLEVYINVAEDGAITVKGHKIFSSKGTEVDATTSNKLNRFINVDVDKSSNVQKLVITVYNPVTVEFDLYKKDTSGNAIKGAGFIINRTLVKSKVQNGVDTPKTVTTNSDSNGLIKVTDEWLDPGVYKYEVTETATAGKQYINILQNCKAVIYVNVAENGDVSIVADKEGNKFEQNTKYKYYIEGFNGKVVDTETQNIIHGYLTLSNKEVKNSHDEVDLAIVNPVQFNVDIVKVDQRKATLNGTKFSVVRDNNVKVIDNKDITTDIECTEKYLQPGEHTYRITEDSTLAGYINILKGRFIKVKTELTSTGVLSIKDASGNKSNYFEIYEGKIDEAQNAKLLDRTQYKDLYDKVGVESVLVNGVYTLKVKVENPDRTYKFALNKKIFGDENINLGSTTFTVISEFSGKHAGLVTDKNGNISFKEERVPAGTYKYYITETRKAGKQFVNVLEDNLYVVVILKVNEDGTIQIVDENGANADKTYYLYRQRANSTLLDKVDFNDTVADLYVNVSTAVENKLPVLNIYVKNPEFYNFELIKKDKDTKQRLNGVKFNLTVYNDNKKITLKDAETLEEIVNNPIVTQNVDGKDGVIVLPKILIEKAGSYVFELREESTEGIFNYLYKSHAQDIRIKVDIAVENGEYVVKTPTVVQGGKYVDFVNTSTSKSQNTTAEITNERIKGSYSLALSKLDSYTNNPLNDAEFDVSVEKDGKAYELYKVTDDVESKDVIIPGKMVVNGKTVISDIRIDRPETYIIKLTETKAPAGYMLLDEPIQIKVTTARNGQYDDEEFIVESAEIISGDNHGLVSIDNKNHEINVTAKNEYFDLALRKSITTVAYSDKDESKITEDETKDRVPEVVSDELLANTATTAKYNHVKNHVRAYNSQDVIFTLRVYNEGEIDGYAQEITDYLPEGLEFVNDEFNNERGWKQDTENSRIVRTRKLSKEENAQNNVIKAVNKETGVIDYKEIQIKCRISKDVKPKTVLTNIAEISDSIAKDRTSKTVDRDSTTNNVKVPNTSDEMSKYKEDELTNDRNTYVPGQEDDDDFEKIIVEEFDLALRKYITSINNEDVLKEHTENETDAEKDIVYAREPVVNVSALKDGSSTTATYTHPKDPVEVSVGDIVTYTLQVFNEGTVSGYASLIKDDIPEGLEFVPYVDGDGSTNDIYRWKMVDENDNEVTDPSKAKYVISDYLSKANESEENSNLIKAFEPDTMDKLDSKYVRIAFKVICKQDYAKIIENQAQISDDSDDSGKSVIDRDSTPNEWKGEDDEDVEYVKVTYMDLALRKFITGVNDQNVTSRIPQVDATSLINETGTTAKYTHPKDPVLVHTNDIVTYTIRVYNEGSKDGYATGIKDDIPEGLEYLPNNEINREYEWYLADENDNIVTDLSKAKYVITNYLSKDNESESRNNLMKAFDKDTMDTPEYKDVKIAFKVTEPTTSDRILINYAQISEQTDGKGIHRPDRDSTPNEWKGEDDEDIEKVRVQYFDLSLRKWVTQAIVTENGKTVVTQTGHKAEDDPEEVVKVDLKKSKINNVVVKFRYSIRITNEGEIAGEATEIRDDIPQGLKFVAEDNPDWREENGQVVTNKLEHTTLQPGESAEVEILLTWVNSKDNMGVMTNIAEINKDHNDYGTPDIDSTPGNNVPGEDDIDDAPVMLTVKTGSEYILYAGLALSAITIIAIGGNAIRKRVLRDI